MPAKRRVSGAARLAAVCALASLITACSGGACSFRPTQQRDASARVSSAEAAAAVRQFDPADLETSIDRLNAASFAAPAAVEAIVPFLDDADPARRFAAVYLAALLVDEKRAPLLQPALDGSDLAVRVIAAGALAGHGHAESLPVLIEALGSDAWLPYDDPPRPASDLAREALTAYTGQSFASQSDWQAWWVETSGRLRWDGKRYVAR